MNTISKKLFTILSVLIFMFGCKKDSEEFMQSTVSNPSLPIYGNWKSVSYERWWNPAPFPDPYYSSATDTGTIEILLNADSTFQIWSDDSTIVSDTGVYHSVGGRLGLTGSYYLYFQGSEITYLNDSNITINFYHDTEFTLNDTGSAPIYGDISSAMTTYLFKKQ